MAGLTDKQVKIKFSGMGGAKATDTSNNGDVIFDAKNKYIYTRGNTFDCTTTYNKIDSSFNDGLKIASITPFGSTDSSSSIWIPIMSSTQNGVAKLGYTTNEDSRAVLINTEGRLYINQRHYQLSKDSSTTATSSPDHGGTFTAITDFTTNDHTIKPTVTTFTLPSSVDGLSGGMITGDVSVDGLVYADAFYESSDERYKDNIQDISTFTDIPGVYSFNWKETGLKSYGFIAQELEKQYPELVNTRNDGFKSVNYDATLALIVGKLVKRIEHLENEIKELKSK